jgi:hypothetical protein
MQLCWWSLSSQPQEDACKQHQQAQPCPESCAGVAGCLCVCWLLVFDKGAC